MSQAYFKNLYRRAMDEAYGLAFDRVAEALRDGGAAACEAPSARM